MSSFGRANIRAHARGITSHLGLSRFVARYSTTIDQGTTLYTLEGKLFAHGKGKPTLLTKVPQELCAPTKVGSLCTLNAISTQCIKGEHSMRKVQDALRDFTIHVKCAGLVDLSLIIFQRRLRTLCHTLQDCTYQSRSPVSQCDFRI